MSAFINLTKPKHFFLLNTTHDALLQVCNLLYLKLGMGEVQGLRKRGSSEITRQLAIWPSTSRQPH